MTLENFLASHKLIFAVLFLVTFIVFGNTFSNEWTYDDIPVVIDNPDILSLENFSKDTYSGRPLRELSYMLDYKLFGGEPAGYHLQQNLWHAANGCLLFLVMSTLGIKPAYALLGTLLFLLHPLQTESVANIGHRKELLPLFFGLLLFLAYVKSLTISGARRWLLWLVCLLSYSLVLLGNITAGPFPLLLFVYELLFVEKQRRLLTRHPLASGTIVFSLAVACGFYFAQTRDFQDALVHTYVQNGFLGTKDYLPMFMVALKVPVFYLGKLFWPVSLAPEYVVKFSKSLMQWWSLVGFGLLVSLMTLFWVCRKRLPVMSFSIAWCLLLYFPVSNLVPVYAYPMADRYLYMILPGVGMGLAILLQKSASRVVSSGAVIVLFALSLLTLVQNTHWRNDYALWSHAAVVNPESKGAIWSLASTQFRRGELQEAKAGFNKVLELDRFFVHAYLKLAQIQEMEGDYAAAKKNYQFFVRYGQYSFPDEAMKIQSYLRNKYR